MYYCIYPEQYRLWCETNNMAELSEGVNGPLSGKVGNVVFYTRNGKTYARIRPRKRGKKRTVKEKNNTTGFAKVQKWMKPIGRFLKYGFKDSGISEVPYRSAVSYALNNAIHGAYPNQYIDPSLVRVTSGELTVPKFANVVLEEGGIVRFTWDKGDSTSRCRDDQAMLLAYSPETQDRNDESHQYKVISAFRREGTDTLEVFPARYEHEFHFYLGFVNEERTQQSNSMYLGSILVPGMEQDELFATFDENRRIKATKKAEAAVTVKDKTLDIARNLRNMGLTDQDIATATGLSLAVIEGLDNG